MDQAINVNANGHEDEDINSHVEEAEIEIENQMGAQYQIGRASCRERV